MIPYTPEPYDIIQLVEYAARVLVRGCRLAAANLVSFDHLGEGLLFVARPMALRTAACTRIRLRGGDERGKGILFFPGQLNYRDQAGTASPESHQELGCWRRGLAGDKTISRGIQRRGVQDLGE